MCGFPDNKKLDCAISRQISILLCQPMANTPKRWPELVLAALLVMIVATLGSLVAGSLEWQRQIRQLEVDIALRRELLRSELERHRLLPTALARNPKLAVAVDRQAPMAARAAAIDALNIEFEELARADGTATLYLVDARGITVAASNHLSAASFIGQDYSFRPYFRDAMRIGTGQLFAQGTVSGVAGLYLAQRLSSGSGVIVTKVEFTDLERKWRTGRDETLVIDDQSTVLLASDPQRRFTQYAPDAQRADRTISSALPASYQNWMLVLQRDIGPALWASRLTGAAIGGLLGLLAAVAMLMTSATRRRRDRQRIELELLVTSRTTELETSNQKLIKEIDERERSEATVQKLREDLAQANRLAILGQISAGVAHEINQPTAAIRTYVDNARKLFERGQPTEALATLATIASLTERIGLITDELRDFSRRSPVTREALHIGDAIDGSLLLLDQSLRMRRVVLQRPNAPERQCVHANRTRLEQVIVNLIQNAMDALVDTAEPTITIESGGDEREVWIRIADNGPGVAPERRNDLFAPFSSTKPLGLGLGLVICRDIIADFGGSLEFAPNESGGALFTVRMPTCRL